MIDNNLNPIPISEMQGINPVAKLDTRDRKTMTRVLKHKHMVETIERFKWLNLPPELPSDIIERILYFRFKGAMFKANDKYFFLPFALKDEIDSYGRYIGITPVLFTGQWKVSNGKFTEDIAFISGKKYKVIYDLPSEKPELDELDQIEYSDHAVMLTDSSLEVSQDYTPMEYLIRPFIEQMVDILVLVNIDLITSAKVFYVIAKDENQKTAIMQEFNNLDQRILNGQRVVVVTSAVELKELTGKSTKDSSRYFQSYQSLDNLRKDIIGISNGGTFMKQEHTTEAETEMNTTSSSSVLNNALRMRKEFCRIVNKVFELDIDVELNQNDSADIVEPEGAQSKERNEVEE